jgi:microcystin-dependent protein
MSCESCYNGCVVVTPDECVRYTGLDVPALGIYTGDTLKHVEQMITDKLVPLLTGTGDAITLASPDVCTLITGYLTAGLTHNSQDWIKALAKGECDLQAQVLAIDSILATLNADYSIGCLSGVTASSDTHDIVQAIITNLCATAAGLTALELDVSTNYVKLADLNTLIQAYLDSQAGNVTQQYQKMVPYTAVEYYGPLTNFDGTGAGKNNLGWNKVYLCNGLNGTPDKRGRVGVGAIVNVPGGPLNTAVDPIYVSNPNYAINDTIGANAITLTTNQIPSHTHIAEATSIVTDPGHTHTFNYLPKGGGDGSNVYGSEYGSSTKAVSTTTTGITVTTNITNNNTGGGNSHANIQPVLACYYIMYIPS